MNKQEAIEKIEKLKGLNIKEKNLILDIEMIPKGDVLEIIEQIDEPEKPVVPRCVADFISSEQRSCSALSEAIDNMDMRDEGEVTSWFYDNSETFAKAWLFGYEIEKEKLYTVEIPSHGTPDHIVLRKHVDGEVCIDYYRSGEWRDYKCAQLTEAEIKKDFDWAWKYAEDVEE